MRMTKVKSEQITGLVVKYPGVRNKKEVSADIQQQNHKNLKPKRRKCCSCCLSEINDEPSSFWTGIMTNLGICTLLLAYILLGEFLAFISLFFLISLEFLKSVWYIKMKELVCLNI